jgi:hypothetical protein
MVAGWKSDLNWIVIVFNVRSVSLPGRLKSGLVTTVGSSVATSSSEFPASGTHFLCRFSEVISAGTENSKDPSPLRRYLSPKETYIALDNAESVLDP